MLPSNAKQVILLIYYKPGSRCQVGPLRHPPTTGEGEEQSVIPPFFTSPMISSLRGEIEMSNFAHIFLNR